MSGSAQCPHPDLHFHLNQVHCADANVKLLELTATCNVCGAPMVWLGAIPFGGSMATPTRSLDARTISLPMIGEGEQPSTELSFIGRIVA